MNAAKVGRKVLLGAAKGRQRAAAEIAARHAALVTNIVLLFNQLTAQGVSVRGMAGRISRRLGGKPCERHVLRIISDMQGGKSDVVAHNPAQHIVGRAT